MTHTAEIPPSTYEQNKPGQYYEAQRLLKEMPEPEINALDSTITSDSLTRDETQVMGGSFDNTVIAKIKEFIQRTPGVLWELTRNPLNNRKLSTEALYTKAVILAAYTISPVDLAPEIVLGPLGLADDVLVANELRKVVAHIIVRKGAENTGLPDWLTRLVAGKGAVKKHERHAQNSDTALTA